MDAQEAYRSLASKLSGEEREALDALVRSQNAERECLERERDLRGDALEKLKQWAEAYPMSVFPEVAQEDWKRAAEVLAAAGLSLDRISASNMRHVITQVGKLIDAGLAP